MSDAAASIRRQQLIDKALPRRRLPVHRDALIRLISHEIDRWERYAPEIGPHAERIRKLTKVTKTLQSALEKATSSLRELGALDELKEVYIWKAALTNPIFKGEGAQTLQTSIDNARAAVDAGVRWHGLRLWGSGPLVDLYLVPLRAQERLRKWNRFYRPPSNRPRDLKVDLIRNLRVVLCERPIDGQAPEIRILSKREFEDKFIPTISGSEGLPNLDVEAVGKREDRARGKSGQKSKGTK